MAAAGSLSDRLGPGTAFLVGGLGAALVAGLTLLSPAIREL